MTKKTDCCRWIVCSSSVQCSPRPCRAAVSCPAPPPRPRCGPPSCTRPARCHSRCAAPGPPARLNMTITTSASKSCIRRFVNTEKAPTRAFSWLKAATTAFTFKTLLRHYAKRALTPQSLNVKLGPRHKGHKGRAV